MPITDIGGRPIPPDGRTAGSAQPVLAVPPTFQQPDLISVEFLYSAFLQAAAATAAFVGMTDAVGLTPFAQAVDGNYRGKIANIFIYCPDMVAALTPYLSVRVLVNQQPANAWGTIPIAPRNGIASLSFDTQLMLPPGSQIGLQVQNIDPANAHFVMAYLYGWTWSK